MKYLLCLLAVVLIFACKSEKKEASQKSTSTPLGLQALQKANTVAPAVQTTKSNLIYNPQHGQAGHNCALAVGAPLNQPVAQPQQVISQIPKPQTVNVKQSVAVNNKGEKLNPKHGEPGHRCDIAVGAPLSSKSIPKVQPSPAQTIVPAAQEAKTLESQNGVKLNPKHGEPGHRCDIAVGAPLS